MLETPVVIAGNGRLATWRTFLFNAGGLFITGPHGTADLEALDGQNLNTPRTRRQQL